MKLKPLSALGGAALMLTAVVGCSTQQAQSPQGSAVPVATEQPATEQLAVNSEVSRVNEFTEISELAAESDLVIIATVSDKHELVDLNGLDFTDRVVVPEKTLKGEAAAEITVFELGVGNDPLSLQPGTTHLLFLAAYELEPNQPTGKFAVTGLYAGDYVQGPDGTFKKRDTESSKLPETLPSDFSI